MNNQLVENCEGAGPLDGCFAGLWHPLGGLPRSRIAIKETGAAKPLVIGCHP